MSRRHALVAILPCRDLDRSQAFYERLGFRHIEHSDDYRLMRDGNGGELHLAQAPAGSLAPDRNPFGLYLYCESVDAFAAEFDATPERTAWGMYEFGLADPDGTQVHVGWPSRLHRTKA